MPNIADYVTPIYDNVAIGPFVSPPGFVLEQVWFYEKTAAGSLANLGTLLDTYASFVNDGIVTCEQIMTFLPGFIADELAAIYAGRKIMAAGHVANDPGFSYNGPPGTCPASSHLPAVWSAQRVAGLPAGAGITTYRWLNAGGDCTFEVFENNYYTGPISAADFPDAANFTIGTYYGGPVDIYPELRFRFRPKICPFWWGSIMTCRTSSTHGFRCVKPRLTHMTSIFHPR